MRYLPLNAVPYLLRPNPSHKFSKFSKSGKLIESTQIRRAPLQTQWTIEFVCYCNVGTHLFLEATDTSLQKVWCESARPPPYMLSEP
jgi:hypothetical protein